MNRKTLTPILVFIIIVGLIFVSAALGTPAGLVFFQNATTNFDNDGTVFLNWTAVSNAENYTLFIYTDRAMFTSVRNSSISGYVFSNTTDANYTFTVQAENSTGATEYTNSTNISIVVDDTVPAIAYGGGMASNAANSTNTFIYVNVTATDTYNDTLSFTLYNTTGIVNQTNFTDSYATTTINWTGLSAGVYYYNVTGNDSATNTNTTSTYTFTNDVTSPSASASCSPSSGHTGYTVTCTCTASDGGSGLSSSTATSTPDTSVVGTYTYTCTATDYAGNSASSTATYTVLSSSVISAESQQSEEIHSWGTITPGTTAIMEDFNEDIGIKQIQIEVNSEAQNVKLTVTGYDGKPEEVSVEKSGEVYQYIQINASNLENKLDKAIVQFRVEKSWVDDNLQNIEELTVFKFNEISGEWEELTTTYSEADDSYYYYNVELTSFSYFALGEKTSGGGLLETEKNLVWLWVLLGVVVLVIIVSALKKIKKKR